MIRPEPSETEQRARLAGALAGVGGPLHRLVGHGAMDRVDVEAGKGIAFSLASGSDDPVVQLHAQVAAGIYVVTARTLGAVGHGVGEPGMGRSGRHVLDLARAATVLARAFERTVLAVEAMRARARQRTSIPEFTVRRIVPDKGTGGP
jgi:hypothetical protein